MKLSKILEVIVFIFVLTFLGCQKEPTAAFTVSKTTTIPNDLLLFTNISIDADHYEWNFGDGNRSNDKNPTHAYTKLGEYAVTLVAFSNKNKESNPFSQKITIGTSPISSFTYSPKYPKPGETVHFIDNTANNPTSWLWEFGDGTTSTEKSPNHIYTSENTYHLTLNVTNDYGTFKQTDSVVVLNNMPVMPSADFTLTLAPYLAVNFKDSSAGNPNLWLWNFGDATTSTLQNPSHRYSHGGSFSVTLRVFNLAGSNQITKLIFIPSTLSEASFIYYEGENYTIYFTDMSTTSPILWEWDFGDGVTSTLQNPIHQYSQAGTYTVILKVTNNAGLSQKTQAIYVSNYDYAFFAGNYNVIDEGAGSTTSYTDVITATAQSNKFYTANFGNLANSSIYFLLNGTTVTVPSQTVHCGTPPNDLDHTFIGNGYFIQENDVVNMVVNYRDSTYLGVYNKIGRYNTIK